MVVWIGISDNNSIVRNHPVDDISDGDALANGLYIFDSILAKETLKDAGDKKDHGPVSLFSQ